MNTLFLVAMIIQALFGLGFTLIPDLMLAPFGVTFNPTATVFANLFGSALIGYVVLLWFARKSDSLNFKQATVYSEFVFLLISTVIMVRTQLNGLMNPLGWAIVIEHIVLLIWFGYYMVKNAKTSV